MIDVVCTTLVEVDPDGYQTPTASGQRARSRRCLARRAFFKARLSLLTFLWPFNSGWTTGRKRLPKRRRRSLATHMEPEQRREAISGEAQAPTLCTESVRVQKDEHVEWTGMRK